MTGRVTVWLLLLLVGLPACSSSSLPGGDAGLGGAGGTVTTGSGGDGGLVSYTTCPTYDDAVVQVADGPICNGHNDRVELHRCGSYDFWTAYGGHTSFYLRCTYASDGTLIDHVFCEDCPGLPSANVDAGMCVDAGVTSAVCRSANQQDGG